MNGNASNYTEKLGLSQFLASDKPGWLTDYNNDMRKIDQMVDAPEATAVIENGRLKITSAIPRLGNSYAVQFISLFDFDPEMPVEIDGAPVSLFDSDGRPAQYGWKDGDFVHIQRMGQAARVLSPLLNKVDLPEFGTNENGSYIKHSDGRLECEKTIAIPSITLSVPRGNIFTDTVNRVPGQFAVPFAVSPSIEATVYGGSGHHAIWLVSAMANVWWIASGTNLVLQNQTDITFRAKGRWKV